MKKIVEIIGSTGTTIVILLFLILLVIIGTLEQTQIGLYRAQKEYFHAIISFFPSSENVVLKIPFPGGTLLFFLLLLNLVVSFIVKFKKRWKQKGVWICHIGLIFLIIGSFITFVFSEEGNISIEKKRAVNEFSSSHEVELLLADSTSPQFDQVAIFSQDMLVPNAILTAKDFPFLLKILEYHKSCFALPKSDTTVSSIPSLDEHNFPLHSAPNKEEGARIAIFLGEEKLAEFSAQINISVDFTHQFNDNVGKYSILLRKKTMTLPFSLSLIEFSPEFYPGTETPRSFESHVRVIDGELQREAIIRMNRPLRHNGYTFYQNSYAQSREGYTSVLAVVHNPGQLWPYFSCILIFVGMLMHFIYKIASFLRRNH